MRLMGKLVLATSLFLSTSACFADAPSCLGATVTNTSQKTWIIEYKTTYGHVDMNGANCTSSHCVLAPNQSVQADYYYDGGNYRRGPATGGSITIIDHNGKENVMNYYVDDVGQSDLCPEIMNYNGSQGVTLNQPANGDINTDHNAWQ